MSLPSVPDEATLRVVALRMLGAREYSRLKLQRRLLSRFPDSGTTVEALLTRLEQEGWLSDQRFAEIWYRQRLASAYGPIRIQAEARQAGIAEDVAAILERDAPDWDEVLAIWLARRFGARPIDSAKEWKRRVGAAQRRGFTGQQVQRQLGFPPRR